MKWIKRLTALLLVLLVVFGAYVFSTATRTEKPVGFQVVRVESPSGPIAVALWYPTSGSPHATTFVSGNLLSVARDAPVLGIGLPLIVISHGNGGSALSHVDLAMDLASAGYVVAAPTHTGDNYADQSRQSSPALFNQRAEQVRATLDYMLERWPYAHAVDRSRVGAYGFSAGGFTVLTLAGGTPDLSTIADHCQQTPEFICKALAQVRSPLMTGPTGAGTFKPDARIRAAVVAAPGLGFTFGRDGLSDVHIPVQVWHGDKDQTVPYASNVRIVEEGLGDHAEPHTLREATHLSFLAPCGLLKPPSLCNDPSGFDRVAAHEAMNAEVIRFFGTHLSAVQAPE